MEALACWAPVFWHCKKCETYLCCFPSNTNQPDFHLFIIIIYLLQDATFWSWGIIILQSVASDLHSSLKQTFAPKQREILKAEQSNDLWVSKTRWNLSKTTKQGKVCYIFRWKLLFWCKKKRIAVDCAISRRCTFLITATPIVHLFNNTCNSLFIHLNLWKW